MSETNLFEQYTLFVHNLLHHVTKAYEHEQLKGVTFMNAELDPTKYEPTPGDTINLDPLATAGQPKTSVKVGPTFAGIIPPEARESYIKAMAQACTHYLTAPQDIQAEILLILLNHCQLEGHIAYQDAHNQRNTIYALKNYPTLVEQDDIETPFNPSTDEWEIDSSTIKVPDDCCITDPDYIKQPPKPKVSYAYFDPRITSLQLAPDLLKRIADEGIPYCYCGCTWPIIIPGSLPPQYTNQKQPSPKCEHCNGQGIISIPVKPSPSKFDAQTPHHLRNHTATPDSYKGTADPTEPIKVTTFEPEYVNIGRDGHTLVGRLPDGYPFDKNPKSVTRDFKEPASSFATAKTAETLNNLKRFGDSVMSPETVKVDGRRKLVRIDPTGQAYDIIHLDTINLRQALVECLREDNPNPNSLSYQVGGEHYQRFKIQPAEFTTVNQLPANESSAIWYLCRHADKGKVDDLLKAMHFIEMIIDMQYGARETFLNWCRSRLAAETKRRLESGEYVTPQLTPTLSAEQLRQELIKGQKQTFVPPHRH